VTGRGAAPRPEGRTATYPLEEPFTGWTFTARLDFPARYLEEMQSGDLLRVCRAMDTYLIVAHNFPGIDGTPAPSMLDVWPVDGVLAALRAWQRGSKLPNP
jgi:hypothetical protein